MSRITTIFISLLVVFLLGFFYAWPQYQRVSGLMNELQERKTELKLKKEYFVSVKEAASNLESYQEEIAKIDSALPSKPFLPSLFRFANDAAAQNGLIMTEVGKFSVTPSRNRPELKEIFLEVSLSGPYSSLRNFLSAVEKSSRMIEIDSLVFDSAEAKDNTSPFSLKLKAHSY